jgi:hypothetical protein
VLPHLLTTLDLESVNGELKLFTDFSDQDCTGYHRHIEACDTFLAVVAGYNLFGINEQGKIVGQNSIL